MVYQDIEELRKGPDESEQLRRIADFSPKGADDPPTQESREDNKYNDTAAGKLAGDPRFENFTIAVICLNALWIGYDTEYTATIGKADNLYNGPAEFIVMENFFAVFFTFEMGSRAVGYRVKTNAIWDGWFVFDSLLVILMILETWIMPAAGGGGMGGLGILRLLRLLRITRMAKLMRAIPEIMTIVKGLVAALRSVGTTAVLMALVTYVFAIILTSTYHQGLVADGDEPDNAMVNFGSMGKSVFSLIIMGAIFDDLTYCTDSIRETGNTMMLIVFIIYMLMTGFTVMNMLIGILAEVVQATGEGETKAAELSLLTESIQSIISKLDVDGNEQISQSEFQQMKSSEELVDVLETLKISYEQFDKYGELVFGTTEAQESKRCSASGEPAITYTDLVRIIYKLRPGTTVGALELACFQHGVGSFMSSLDKKMKKLEKVSMVAACGAESSSVEKLMRSPTFTCPTPTANWAGSKPFGVTDPLSPAHRGAIDEPALGVEKCSASDLRQAAQAPSAAPSGAPFPAPSTVGDPRWRLMATSDLLAEVQRRLNSTDAAAESLRKQARDARASGVAADAAFATLGVPAPTPG